MAEILSDQKLRASWEIELATMRERINSMRAGFAEAMADRGFGNRFAFVAQQFGMFSFLGLSVEQIDRLREESSIYMLKSSRISFAGLTQKNLNYAADAIASVMPDDEKDA